MVSRSNLLRAVAPAVMALIALPGSIGAGQSGRFDDHHDDA